MAKKQETVLTDVAGKIGSTLGIIAAEAAKVMRPLTAKRATRSRSQAHAPAVKRKATASGRSTRRHATSTMRRRTKRSS
jgi:hypothetical protein